MIQDLNKLSFQELKAQVESLEKQKESIGKVSLKDSAFVIGENYLIRTVFKMTDKLEDKFPEGWSEYHDIMLNIYLDELEEIREYLER